MARSGNGQSSTARDVCGVDGRSGHRGDADGRLFHAADVLSARSENGTEVALALHPVGPIELKPQHHRAASAASAATPTDRILSGSG